MVGNLWGGDVMFKWLKVVLNLWSLSSSTVIIIVTNHRPTPHLQRLR